MNELDLIKPPTNYITSSRPRDNKLVGWVEIPLRYGGRTVMQYQHFIDGKLNSVNGQPATIEMLLEDASKLYKCEWYLDNELHRIDGPARMYRTDSKNIKLRYFIDGMEIDKIKFYSHPLVIKHKLNMILDI